VEGGEDDADPLPPAIGNVFIDTYTSIVTITTGRPADPLPVYTVALGDLGLIEGQPGNSGLTPSQLAQVLPTIVEYEQWQTDIASIVSTGGNNSEVAGDIALLEKIGGYLRTLTSAVDILFGNNTAWITAKQTATLEQWVTDFYANAQRTSDLGETISASEREQLLATTLPAGLSTAEANEFLDRWNRTVQYWFAGIVTASQVPAGESTDFLDADALRDAFGAAQTTVLQVEADGYSDIGAEFRAALTTVLSDLNQNSVCATVKLQISQTATLTRSAFSGTLTLTNQMTDDALEDVQLDLYVTDANGNLVNGIFYISSPTFAGQLTAVDGTANLPAMGTGSVTYTFVPTDSAAPTSPTLYHIGGTLKYVDPDMGGEVTTDLFPSAITVYPQAKLQLNYFLQQTVIGDDPFTSQVEPSEPATLGLLVTNVGGGTASNLSITTAQPQIVQNDKGLAVNIQIIGTKVGNQSLSPSLTVGFGNLASGQTADASFLLTASLQGVFENFTATFTHSDALGGIDTSLIGSVVTHSLVHAGNFPFANSTNATDYLVDDVPDPQDLPDTIYFSDGTTAPVNIATNAAASPVGASGQLTYQVTANVTSGWDYFQLPDPGAGYTLYKVVSSDGTALSVSDQAWTTDRTISLTGRSTVDNELHILDANSTGSYMVYYRPTSTTVPTVASISPVSSPQSGPISSVEVTFSTTIDPSTFTTGNLNLSLNGSTTNLINSAVTITHVSGTEFTIGGLSGITAADGNYTLTVNATGVSDYFGDVGSTSSQISWSTSVNYPVVVSVGAGDLTLRNTPVTSVDVVLSEPINPASFSDGALTLTLNGGSNLISSGVTVTQINPTTYRIGGLSALTSIDGNYVLTVNATGLTDGSGNSGIGALSETWKLDTVAPTIGALQSVDQSPRKVVVPTLDVTFSKPIDPTTFTYQDITYSRDGGPNLITSQVVITQLSSTEFEISNFNGGLSSPPDGTYTFTVGAVGVVDLAGNIGIGSASDTWVLDTTPSAAPTNLAISPDNGSSNTDGITDTGSITLSGTLGEAGLTVDVYDSKFGIDLGSETVTGTTFQFSLNLSSGTHQLQITATDGAGNVSTAASYTATIDLTPPAINSVSAVTPNPRNTAVSTLSVTLSEPIDSSTFDWHDLTLTRDGGPNLITNAVTVTLVSGSTYQIAGLAGLTTSDGNYMLTVNAQAIADIAGNAGINSVLSSWVMDTTTPAAPTNLAITPNTGVTPGLTNTGTVILSGSLTGSIRTVDIFDASTNVDLGQATIVGSAFSLPLNLAVGTHQLVVTDISQAGNQSAPTSFTVVVDETAPTATLAMITGPRTTLVDTEFVIFSEPISSSTLSSQTLTLTLNGGPNLMTSAVNIVLVSGNTYEISGLGSLTTADGHYVLSLNPAAIRDLAGNPGTGAASVSWTLDTKKPTSSVINTLTLSPTGLITGTVTANDLGTNPSGVASVAVYVTTDSNPFPTTPFAILSPTNLAFTHQSQPGHHYYFRSVAIDAAGNVESKPVTIEAGVYAPVPPPVTMVVSATPNSSNATIILALSGTDAYGPSLRSFSVYVRIDSGSGYGAMQLVGTVSAGSPDSSGIYRASITYQAAADGANRSYEFFSVGTDSANLVEPTHTTPDVTLSNQTFSMPFQFTGLTIQHGEVERSFIEYVDLDFNQGGAQLQAFYNRLIANPGAYLQMVERPLGASTNQTISLTGVTFVLDLVDHLIEIDFGQYGLGGVGRNGATLANYWKAMSAADGWYELNLDATGTGTFNSSSPHDSFERLLGDTNGDGTIDATDAALVALYQGQAATGLIANADLNGDGVIDSTDTYLVGKSKGRTAGINPFK
jgi:hypothetical protein